MTGTVGVGNSVIQRSICLFLFIQPLISASHLHVLMALRVLISTPVLCVCVYQSGQAITVRQVSCLSHYLWLYLPLYLPLCLSISRQAVCGRTGAGCLWGTFWMGIMVLHKSVFVSLYPVREILKKGTISAPNRIFSTNGNVLKNYKRMSTQSM